jgi:hypothetical protein
MCETVITWVCGENSGRTNEAVGYYGEFLDLMWSEAGLEKGRAWAAGGLVVLAGNQWGKTTSCILTFNIY